MNEKLVVTPSPHLSDRNDTRRIMLDVLIALAPALVAACIIFGMRSLIVTIVAAGSCMLFEYLFCKIAKTPVTVKDLSAAVTGVILAFNLPVTIPVYMVIIGSFVSIVVVKMLFGGIGRNFANPALTGRIVLMISFPAHMTNFVVPFFHNNIDAVASATPLATLKFGEGTLPSLLDMFLGVIPGSMGEVSALALLIGFAYLLVRKVIKPTTPVVFVGTVFVLSLVAHGGDFTRALYEILGGGLLLGAIFMATDYTTSPLTTRGKIVFAFGCGLVTVAIRLWGSYTEGVSFAIILMNLLVPYIERMTRQKAVGGVYSG